MRCGFPVALRGIDPKNANLPGNLCRKRLSPAVLRHRIIWIFGSETNSLSTSPSASMKLSQIAGMAGITLYRDGEFEDLGFIQQRQESRLVFVENSRVASAVRRIPGISA